MDNLTMTMYVKIIFCVLMASFNMSNGEDIKEYCGTESFNVTCPKDHVLLITHARYGRMKIGRCIEGQGGNLGCSTNVISKFDTECSGMQSCVVSVHEFATQVPCPKDFWSYLEAAYECIRVPKATAEGCSQNHGVHTHDNDGFIMYSEKQRNISHRQAVYRTPGMVDCPWNIKVRDGQKINLTLMIFGSFKGCNTKLHVEDGPDRKELLLCGGGLGTGKHARQRHIYTSTHSHLIAFISQSHRAPDSDPKYMLHYQAVGCASMTVPAPGWAVRHDSDTMMVACNNTGEKWFLTCTGSNWVGDIANCTKGTPTSSSNDKRNHSHPGTIYRSKLGIIFAVLIGIVLGVTIGALLLLLVHCYKRKRKETHNNNFVMVPQDAKEKFYEEGTYKPSMDLKSGQMTDAYPALLRDTEPYEPRAQPMHLQTAHKQCFSLDNHNMQIKSLPHDRTLYHSLDSKCGECACPNNTNRCEVPGSRYIDVE